jgi:transcriptional regulator with XRE-family HTH domain
MRFTEKLERLTATLNKTKVAKEAGLPSSAVSNYLSKEQMPRGDNALALARSLGVSVEWLVDEEMDWPPPAEEKMTAAQLSDTDLIKEVCARYRREALRLRESLERLEKVDWSAMAKAFAALPIDAPLTPEIHRLAILLDAKTSGLFRLLTLDPSFSSGAFFMPGDLPGGDKFPDAELTRTSLRERAMRLNKIPAYNAVEEVFDLRFSKRAGLEVDAKVDEARRESKGQKPPRTHRKQDIAS